MADYLDFGIDSATTVSASDLLRGSGRLERLAWLNDKLKEGDIYFLQDGKRSQIVFQEAADSFINGQFIAAIALGFSFIERTIAGRLWHVGEKEKANTRKNAKLLNFAKDRGWLTEGEVVSLNNLRHVRNYVVHFRDPDSTQTKVRNIFEKQPKSIDFEKDAYAVMQAAIDVLSSTSL